MPSLNSSEVFQLLFGFVSALISLLLFGNLFFLKKLIFKVDQIDLLTANIGTLAKRLDELCGRIEILNDLRVEVAELKARFMSREVPHRSSGGSSGRSYQGDR